MRAGGETESTQTESLDPVVQALIRAGSFAGTGELRQEVTARQLREAVSEGLAHRLSRGRYALPTAAVAGRAAYRLSGVVSHLSAAAHWQWEMKTPPELPVVSVGRKRRIHARRRGGVEVKWRSHLQSLHTVPSGEADAGPPVTSPMQTVLDCATDLPFDEALAVADSALRHAAVTRQQLKAAADQARGPGSRRIVRVVASASAKAANPFESVLRAIALDVPGLQVEPQVRIKMAPRLVAIHPDLVDERLRLVLEADGHEFHSSRAALTRDCARYVNLVSYGWTVLRFTWEQVMFKPEWVAGGIRRTVEHLLSRTGAA